jgi:hypothetical protein
MRHTDLEYVGPRSLHSCKVSSNGAEVLSSENGRHNDFCSGRSTVGDEIDDVAVHTDDDDVYLWVERVDQVAPCLAESAKSMYVLIEI